MPTEPPRLDVLFCLDTTGSMGDEIQVAKDTILQIAEVVEDGTPRPVVRYALVIFRDIGDIYVTKVYDFMPVEELATILQDVTARGGNDYPESVSEALHRSVHDVTWDLDASCAIYLIGDAPPHTDYDNGFDHAQAAIDARDRNIMINAIGCSGINGHEAEFLEVVEITGGTFCYLTYFEPSGGSSGDVGGWTDGTGSGGTGSEGTGEGTGEGGGDSTGKGTGGGSGNQQNNDLDEVLAGMIQGQAMDAGVDYEDEE